MNELLTSGIELMLIGMGIVYGFLALLVVSIDAMSMLVKRFFPESPTIHPAISHHQDDPGIVAAITAAVQQYRKKHQKN